MVPLNRSDLNLASLVGDEIGAATIGYFNSTTQEWEIVSAFPWGGWSGDFPTSIGSPLWVNTAVAGTWPTPTRSAVQKIGLSKK
jgi:hypothetical protein